MQNIQNLASLNRLGSTGGSNKKAYFFDGVDDYIAGNAAIGRTGYDLNTGGNVSTGSDADGSYFWINGNRDQAALTGTRAEMSASAATGLNQGTSFSMKVRCKRSAFPANNSSGLFCSSFDGGFQLNNSSQVVFGLRGSSTVQVNYAASINTLYDFHLVYDSVTAKFYNYINGVLQNVGGTAGPATFAINDLIIGDNAVTGGNVTSCNKNIYHAAVWNRALSQADITADIALGNTTKSDPTIVAYYVPENLQYNTDYITNKDFTNAAWTKTGTVGTGGQADLRGGTSAALLTISAGAANGVTTTSTALTGSSLASKTFKMKVFAWTLAGTATMRLRISHNGVATYYGTDQTVTTVPQEFTFTQVLTSSTSGTGMTYGIEVGSGAGAATFVAYYPTDWITEQALRDESPNIGGYIGWKTNKIFSCWCKPGADGVNTSNSQVLMVGPWAYIYIRDTTNTSQIRFDNRIGNRNSNYNLGNGFRGKVHLLGYFYWNGSVRATRFYVNGALQDSDTHGIDAPSSIQNGGNFRSGRLSTTYYTGLTRDERMYTGTITDADALAIYQGLQPSTASLYERRGPQPSERGTTTLALGGTTKTGTLNGGVNRVNRPST